MTETVRNNANASIPDDPESSTYRFIIVAAKRARQLQAGARSVLPTTSKKPTVTAMEETRSMNSEDITAAVSALRPVSAANVNGRTNSWAARVITT